MTKSTNHWLSNGGNKNQTHYIYTVKLQNKIIEKLSISAQWTPWELTLTLEALDIAISQKMYLWRFPVMKGTHIYIFLPKTEYELLNFRCSVYGFTTRKFSYRAND